MKKSEEVRTFTVKGNPLKCLVCGHDHFWTRKTLMNTKGVSGIGFAWANKTAENYICDSCGYVHWFFQR